MQSGIQKSIKKKKYIHDIQPYVPTSEEELINARKKLSEKNKNLMNEIKSNKKINCIDASYAGGIDGNQITDQILLNSEVFLFKNQFPDFF